MNIYSISWSISHVHLKKRNILLLLGSVLYILLDLVALLCCSSPLFPHLSSVYFSHSLLIVCVCVCVCVWKGGAEVSIITENCRLVTTIL